MSFPEAKLEGWFLLRQSHTYLIDDRISLLFIVHGSPDECLASVRLAQLSLLQ